MSVAHNQQGRLQSAAMSCLYTNLKFFTIQLIPRQVAVALLKCHVHVGCGHAGVRAAIREVTSSSQVIWLWYSCCVISGLPVTAQAPLTVVRHLQDQAVAQERCLQTREVQWWSCEGIP